MTSQLGAWSLGGGLAVSVAAALLWLRLALAAGAPARSLVRPARLATGASLLAAACTCGILEWALLRHDFSVRFVAENGARQLPVYYTITSLWSSLDGSLLLWLLILAGYAGWLCLAVPAGGRRVHHYAMSVVSLMVVFFFALTYFAANPFHSITPTPVDGPGPNPLLSQHAAMGLHPPLLYAGYIGLVVPFAYAVAGLLTGRTGGAWLAAARAWALPAWAMLTIGITLGAWWSYAVLGWGGYWAWDPVENASLLPWLIATAFLHCALPGQRTAEPGWQVALAGAGFPLVLVGTFLTRSGVVASVHAFTESALGPILLGFILVVTVGIVLLIGCRAQSREISPSPKLLSRPTALLGNRILLTTITGVVLIGTVFPLFTQLGTGTRVSVGPSYFNRAVVPLAIALLALAGLAPLLRSNGERIFDLAHRVALPSGVALSTVTVAGLLSRPGPLPLAAFAAAAFTLTSAARGLARRPRRSGPGRLRRLHRRRRAAGGSLAHAGFALVAIGVTASAAYSATAERDLTIGESVSAGRASVRLLAVERIRAGDDMIVRTRLALTSSGRPDGDVGPQLRYHPRRDVTVSLPDIRSGLSGDTYTTLLAVSADGSVATVRLAVNPMVGMIWAGGALTAIGGLLAIGSGHGRRGKRQAGKSPGPDTMAVSRAPAPAVTDVTASRDPGP